MSDKILKATHEGITKIGNIEINSYVLENGERVFSRIGFLRAIGRTGKAKGGRKYDEEFNLPVFLTAKNLKSFIPNDLHENSKPIIFLDINNRKTIGYMAKLLPEVCNIFIDLADQGNPTKSQIHIIERSKILIRGFATVGIIALVDEATGYQDVRARKALEKILEKYISDELNKWAKTFPDEFYKRMFELRGWPYNPASVKRPSIIGKYTNDLIYERLAPGVLTELQKRNPLTERGHRKHKHFQYLTENIGHPKLREHLASVITLMRASTAWDGFYRLLQRSLPKQNDTIELLLEDEGGKPI